MKTRIKIDSALLSFAIILTGFLYYFPQIYSSSRTMDNIWDFTGILFILKGTLIRMIARGHKKAHSKNGKVLVKTGIYQLTRNPMYLGSFYLGSGFVLIVWPWWGVAIFAGLFYLRFHRQVVIEEEHLKESFGREFEEYCARVPRTFPKFQQLRKTQVREIVDLKQALSTKDKYGLIGWPVLAVVMESVQEKIVFGSTDVERTLLIFLSAAVLYAIVLAARYYKSV